MSEEIRVAASVGGRVLTLDPVRLLTLKLEVREVESAIPCGFQVEWATADVRGDELMVCVGAGFGSRWATIRYQDKSYAFSVEDVVSSFLEALEGQ